MKGQQGTCGSGPSVFHFILAHKAVHVAHSKPRPLYARVKKSEHGGDVHGKGWQRSRGKRGSAFGSQCFRGSPGRVPEGEPGVPCSLNLRAGGLTSGLGRGAPTPMSVLQILPPLPVWGGWGVGLSSWKAYFLARGCPLQPASHRGTSCSAPSVLGGQGFSAHGSLWNTDSQAPLSAGTAISQFL